MMSYQTPNVYLAQQATRERLKKKATQVIRRSVDAVPLTGSIVTFLRSDAAAMDAVLTLSALGHKPDFIVEQLARDRVDSACYVQILAAAVSVELLGFVNLLPNNRAI